MSLFSENTTLSNWNAMHTKLLFNFIFFNKYKHLMSAEERKLKLIANKLRRIAV